MKVLKITGSALLIFILLAGAGAFLLPAHVEVSRQAEINASPGLIFPELNSLRNWEKWSPWYKMDPNSKITYEGPFEGVGAFQSWDSENPDVGKGSMKIVASIPYQKVEIELNFMEAGVSMSTLELLEQEGNTRLTWTLSADMGMNPIARWMGFLLMDKMLGRDFEAGLKNLKEMTEGYSSLSVSERPREAMPYIGIRTTVSEAEIGTALGNLYTRLMEYAEKNKFVVSGSPFTIVYAYSPEKVEMQACLPLQKAGKTEGDIEAARMEAGINAEVDFYGRYEDTGRGHTAIDYWMHLNGKQASGPPYEVYVTDPGMEPDTNKWLTRICYPIN
jgi:effector-binding domain-containing protein